MFEKIYPSYPWQQYSKKLANKIDVPRSSGFFTDDEARERTMFLAEGKEGSVHDGNVVHLYLLVDPDDGMIVDTKFQAYGESALIGAAEVACEILVGKNYDQAKRISADLIDKQVRDKGNDLAFPKAVSTHLNIVLGAIDHAVHACAGLPLPEQYQAMPAPLDFGETLEGGYPGWEKLSPGEQSLIIEGVLTQEVRPYIELDAGGVELLEVVNGCEVHIAYQGSCTSCFAATGSTLSYIQQVLRAKVHPDLSVIPH